MSGARAGIRREHGPGRWRGPGRALRVALIAVLGAGLSVRASAAVEATTGGDARTTPALVRILIEGGDLDGAAGELRRLDKLGRLGGRQAYAGWRALGAAQMDSGDPEQAIESLRTAEALAPDSEARDSLTADRAIAEMASGDCAGASLILADLGGTAADPALRRRASVLGGVCALRLHRFDEARRLLRSEWETAANGPARLAYEQLDRMLAKAASRRPRSPRVARLLSTLLPGAGQIYDGDWWNGLEAMGIDGLGLWWFVSAVEGGAVFEASANSGVFLLRYYRGNLYQAETRARTGNEARDEATCRRAERLIPELAGTGSP